MTKLLKRMQKVIWENKGETYVDTAVKMLFTIVIGALLLVGIYGIFGDIILNNVNVTIQEFFDQTPTLNGGGSGGGNGSGGGDDSTVYADNFADNSWADIIQACQRNEVPDAWQVGDTKPMTINGQEIDIVIIGKNHDEYADGGIAPLTFMTKQCVGQRVLNSTNTNAGGWNSTELYAYLSGELFNNFEYKDSIKAVKKETNIGKADTGEQRVTETETTNDKLFALSAIEVNSYYSGVVNALSKEGKTYEYFSDENSRKLTYFGVSVAWWLRSPNCDDVDKFQYVTGNGIVGGLKPNTANGIAFAFCF